MNIRISPQKVHFLLLAALKDATESFQIVSAVFLKWLWRKKVKGLVMVPKKRFIVQKMHCNRMEFTCKNSLIV